VIGVGGRSDSAIATQQRVRRSHPRRPTLRPHVVIHRPWTTGCGGFRDNSQPVDNGWGNSCGRSQRVEHVSPAADRLCTALLKVLGTAYVDASSLVHTAGEKPGENPVDGRWTTVDNRGWRSSCGSRRALRSRLSTAKPPVDNRSELRRLPLSPVRTAPMKTMRFIFKKTKTNHQRWGLCGPTWTGGHVG
jgi:hypothetical protein